MLGIFDQRLAAFISAVEIESSVRPEDPGVNAVIVVIAAEASEEDLRLADRFVAGFIDGVDKHVRRLRDVQLVPQLADAQRSKQPLVLHEHFVAVAFASVVRVFEDEDAVALGPQLDSAIIGRLQRPDRRARRCRCWSD